MQTPVTLSAADPGEAEPGGGGLTVIGESLVDIIHDPYRDVAGPASQPAAHPGGSPLNVAVGCSRLELQTTLVTHYAEDAYGSMIQDHVASNGVAVINGGSTPTSTAAATLGADGAAGYDFSITWDLNGAALAALAAVENSTHVHTGSIAAVLPPGNQATYALVDAARANATVSFDPNCRPAISPDMEAARHQIELFVAASDIVKASDEDLNWLYPDRTPDETLSVWLEMGPSLVALTRGAAGPVILTGTGRVELAAEPVTVADTVGAGDSFMAGLIAGLAQLNALGAESRQRLRGLTLGELDALAGYANTAAAITCSRQGANPPRTTELGPLRLTLTPLDS